MLFNKKTIIFLILLIVAVRFFLYPPQNKNLHKGHNYSVIMPEGWEKKEAENEVIVLSPETDFMTDKPLAVFSIYAKKVEGAALLLDIAFQEFIESYRKSGWKVIKKGEIKIDEQITKWILCQPLEEESPELLLIFFNLDDFNNMTQIQYLAKDVDAFNKYRPTFEKFKDSIKFKKLF